MTKKRIVATIAVVACCLASERALAQSCKPDISTRDNISKQQVDWWHQVMTSSGVMRAALRGDRVTFFAMVGRSGDTNNIAVQISKLEANVARSAFETQYGATKGDRFLFGVEDGETLSFVADEVLNQAQAGTFSGNLKMNVAWSAKVPDKDLATMRNALTTKRIDAVRISRESGDFDVAVDAENGKRLMEKFVCFYQALEKRGVDLSAAANQVPSAVARDTSKNDQVAKAATVGLTIDQVIRMVAARVPDDVIITTIRTSGSKFALSPDDLIKLKAADVSDELIRAMQR